MGSTYTCIRGRQDHNFGAIWINSAIFGERLKFVMAWPDSGFHVFDDGLHGLINLKTLGETAAEDTDTVAGDLAAHQVGPESGEERFSGPTATEGEADGRALKVHGFEEVPGGVVAGADGIFCDLNS